MELIYLGLGSNLGDRRANLSAAVRAMAPDVRVRRGSRVYETEPWGYVEQAAFFNQVIEAETELDPLTLLRCVKAIEMRVGRKPSFRYGPREIDIDILLYGERVIAEGDLHIPHERLAERAFMLVPLAELAAELPVAGRGETVAQLLARLDASGVNPVNEPDAAEH
jgi:2-amino-4-hydroxy-6-hydroxymethyldihydropteridine diphosphokinase